jgi:ComF family protein
LLGCLLEAWLQTLPQEPYLLLPVPLSAQRLFKRGHNQVETIAHEALTNTPHIVLHTNIITRVRHTQSQTSLPRFERKRNLKKAFILNPRTMHKLAGKKVILLDDVVTTGATLQEVKKALADANASSITTVALAH